MAFADGSDADTSLEIVRSSEALLAKTDSTGLTLLTVSLSYTLNSSSTSSEDSSRTTISTLFSISSSVSRKK